MTEKMTSKIAQVTIRVTGVWEDQEGNSYVHEKEFILQIDTADIETFDQFNELAGSCADALAHNHLKVCSCVMDK